MPVSGLVITLAQDDAASALAFDWLASHAAIQLGPRDGRRVAAVSDTADADADRALRDEMLALAGIHHLDVTFISLDREPATAPAENAR